MRVFDSLVIGGGQAGLSASYHLRRLGIDHVLLDANPGPGGAWQHRWDSLTMYDVHGVADLPGLDQDDADPASQANKYVPAYFGRYEQQFDLPVIRPVTVESVTDHHGILVTSDGDQTWRSHTLVNATGTWTRPFWPYYPGIETFAGQQLHTADYGRAEDFIDRRVLVVGAGQSAVQFLGEIAPLTDTLWVTRKPPVWNTEEFTPEYGRQVVAKVEERVRQGYPPHSVVSVTGTALREQEQAAKQLGAYDRKPMFERIEPDGVRWADGHFEPVDVILWATGFRHAIEHLGPLRLRSSRGGIQLDGTAPVVDPRVQLVGYGPSASTIGANRAGRSAAINVRNWLRGHSD